MYKKISLFFVASCLSFSIFANPVIPIPTRPLQLTFAPSSPNLDATSYILIDGNSGKVLAEKDADKHVAPASLTKLMSLYIISTALKTGQIHPDDKVRISTVAWKTEGSRMFVKEGEEVPVKDLLQGIIVDSGNDATVALAEYIAGSEETFASLMNQEAQALDMKNSHFVDSTGLPNDNHYSTARDLALLTQAYIANFPEDYSYYSEKWFTYNSIRQPNRNRLLWRYQYADGLKTGHTDEAGYCLVGSAKKDGMRLITVVLGEKTDEGRTEDSIRLLTYGFRFFETHKLYSAATALTKARVWEGQNKLIALGIPDDLYVTVPVNQFKRIEANVVLPHPLKAPITKGKIYGTLNVVLNNQVIASKPLVALESNNEGNVFRRASDAVRYKFHQYFSPNTDNKVNTG
jgi:serine-type D-Ala-D-Ala carboxypeptidase (penicillin-binding protein 5/6)